MDNTRLIRIVVHETNFLPGSRKTILEFKNGGQVMTGEMGKYIHDYWATMGKLVNRSLVYIQSSGFHQTNATNSSKFKDVFSLLANDEADVYYAPEPYQELPPQLVQSQVVSSGSLIVFHIIKPKNHTVDVLLSMFQFSYYWWLWYLLICVFLLVTFFATQLMHTDISQLNKKQIFRLLVQSSWVFISSIAGEGFFYSATYACFFILLIVTSSGFALIRLIILNTIQTNGVSQDVNIRISTMNEIEQSNYDFCIEEEDALFFQNVPEGDSLYSRIWRRLHKNPQGMCLGKRDMSMYKTVGLLEHSMQYKVGVCRDAKASILMLLGCSIMMEKFWYSILEEYGEAQIFNKKVFEDYKHIISEKGFLETGVLIRLRAVLHQLYGVNMWEECCFNSMNNYRKKTKVQMEHVSLNNFGKSFWLFIPTTFFSVLLFFVSILLNLN